MHLQKCRFRYLRLHRRPQFALEVIDPDGRTRTGTATVSGKNPARVKVDLGGAPVARK